MGHEPTNPVKPQLWLVLAFRCGLPSGGDEFVNTPESFDRWRELAVHHCDAFREYHVLLAELEKVEEEAQSSLGKKSAFDLGQQSVSYHFSGTSKRVLASYEMLRLAEVTGLPHTAKHFSIFSQGLIRAVNTLADEEPWSASLRILRLASSNYKVLDDFFTRARIALYSVEHVVGLKEVLLHQIAYALPRCQTPTDVSASDEWTNRLAIAVEVLSRITLRFSPQGVREILEHAMQFYRSEALSRTPLMLNPLSNLFTRAIETLLLEDLSRHIPALFALPVPGENNFRPDPLHWPEPVTSIPRSFKVSTNTEREPVWKQIVARLIQALGGSEAEARKRALYRLRRLHEWGLLSSQEQTDLSTALWHHDHLEPNGLPRDSGRYDWEFLILPESFTGQAEAAFRAKYLSGRDNGQRPSVHVQLWMIGAALEQTEKLANPFILTATDMSLIHKIIREWSDTPLLQVAEQFPFLIEDKRRSEYGALQGLRAILLRQDLPQEEAETVWRKVRTMEDSTDTELAGFILYPALAHQFPNCINILTQRLRGGLVSDSQGVAAQAVMGLRHWLHAAQNNTLKIPKPHYNLVREISFAIAARRSSILVPALDLAYWLLQDGPEDYRSLIVEGCEHGLGCLLEEASYTRTRSEVEKHDVPLLRRNCIRLALAMANSGLGNSPAVQGWIDAAREDPLPEVRNTLEGEELAERVATENNGC
jgi:hypothetical protein